MTLSSMGEPWRRIARLEVGGCHDGQNLSIPLLTYSHNFVLRVGASIAKIASILYLS